jgi:hypothetical protein
MFPLSFVRLVLRRQTMRRSVATFITIAAALLGVACEDGPSQTFTPEPQGAGNVINGSRGAGGLGDASFYTSPAQQGFEASTGGGTNPNDLCTATQEKQVWQDNFSAPIVPPGLGAGIDIAGGPAGTNGIWGYDPNCLSYSGCMGAASTPGVYKPSTETWTGVTVEQAEQLLCQPQTQFAYTFVGTTNQVIWGEQGEFSALYDVNSRKLQYLVFGFGYTGNLIGTNATTKTTYTVNLNNNYLTKSVNGGAAQNVPFNWTDGSLPGLTNEIYEAFRQSFIPAFPADADCVAVGHCVIGNNLAEGGYLYFTPLNLAIYVDDPAGTAAQASFPQLIQLGLLKVLPFSNAAAFLKLDSAGTGPEAIATGIGSTSAPRTCDYKLGMKFGDPMTAGTFEHDCVQPFSASDPDGPTDNAIAQAQILGALAHGDEYYTFDIQGVDPQFAATTLLPNEVLNDTQTPAPGDSAYEFHIDQGVLGDISNDYTNNDTTQLQDWHGIGMVTLEWANLLQHYLTLNYGVTTQLGDPTCIANPAQPPLPDGGVYPPGTKICSGLEGIVTTAPPSLAPASMAPNALGPAGVTAFTGAPCSAAQLYGTADAGGGCGENNIALGLKPGTWYAYICADAGGLDANGVPVGYTNCTANYYFTEAQAAVQAAFGNLPPNSELLSLRFYFKQWILALVKYLETADHANATLTSIDTNNLIDPNEVFFDSAGGGFEQAVYVDRANVNPQDQAPTTVTIAVNLLTAVISDYFFDRYNFRGETALYTALKDKASDQPGAEPLLLSNLAGAPVLEIAYPPSSGGYACAINTDPTPATSTSACQQCANAALQPPAGEQNGCPIVVGPGDGFGNPLYAPYSDSFGNSPFTVASLGVAPQNSGLVITGATPSPSGEAGATELIQSATVQVPLLSQPFGYAGSVPPGTKYISELLPFLSGANVGFPVTLDGSRDKFYNTLNVDFSEIAGVTTSVSASVDYEYVATTGADGGVGVPNLVVRAIETSSYLGLAFACTEPNLATGSPDVLAVRMYDNANTLLDWIAAHTGVNPTNGGGENPITDCGIQLKYSIYGNYADFITFGVNPGLPQGGLRFGLNAGYGGSVVSDLTIFDPNIVASLGQ